jgi:hypothetical protein
MSLVIDIEDDKLDALSFLKEVIDQHTRGELGVQVVLDFLRLADQIIIGRSAGLEEHVDLRVRLAENVGVGEIGALETELCKSIDVAWYKCNCAWRR